MNKTYKFFGFFLILLTAIVILSALYAQIADMTVLSRGYGQIDYWYDIATEGIFFSLIVFTLGFFPGLFFYRLGKEDKVSSWIIKNALILQMFSVFVMIFPVANYFLTCPNRCVDDGLLILILGIPSLVIYCIGVILQIFYRVKIRDFRLQRLEKVILSLMVISLILVGIFYVVAHI